MPNQATIGRLADYFGISASELISGEPFTPKQKNTAPGTGNGNPAQQTLELLIQDMDISEIVELISLASDIKKRRSNSGD